jgi:hypothetical protein
MTIAPAFSLALSGGFLETYGTKQPKPMTRKRNLIQAAGYVRTSSAANVGADKDSEPRQRRAIERFAKSAGFVIVGWFKDPAVSGADPIESRPGFAALLNRIEGNGVRVVWSRMLAASPVT